MAGRRPFPPAGKEPRSHPHLGVKIGPIAKAAQQKTCATSARGINRKTRESDHLQLAWVGLNKILAHGLNKRGAFRCAEHRGLARIDADRDDQLAAHGCRAFDHLDMAVGERIEGPGIERDALHRPSVSECFGSTQAARAAQSACP